MVDFFCHHTGRLLALGSSCSIPCCKDSRGRRPAHIRLSTHENVGCCYPDLRLHPLQHIRQSLRQSAATQCFEYHSRFVVLDLGVSVPVLLVHAILKERSGFPCSRDRFLADSVSNNKHYFPAVHSCYFLVGVSPHTCWVRSCF
jgi:hypothetical protein